MRGTGRIIWQVLVLLAACVAGVVLPMSLATGARGFAPPAGLLALVLLADLVINARLRGAARPGMPGDTAAARYPWRWLFIDALAFVSAATLTWWLINAGGSDSRAVIALGLLPLLKLVHLDRLFDDLQDNLKIYPSTLRLVFLVFGILLGAHIIALGWILIGGVDPGLSPGLTYTTSLYWAVTSLTTVGYGDVTPDRTSPLQMFFAMIVMLLGVGMYGYIIGNVATLLGNLDAAKAGHLEKMEEVNVFLKTHDIPQALQDRVRGYYRYLWKTHKSATTHALLDELPPALSVDLALYLNRAILERMPYFTDAGETFIREIVQRLRLQIYLPGDPILLQGEAGDAMYFLSRGEVEILVDGRVIASQTAGTFFGETALIRNERRNATVRAKTFCDLYRLARQDFEELRAAYPEFDRHIREVLGGREGRGTP